MWAGPDALTPVRPPTYPLADTKSTCYSKRMTDTDPLKNFLDGPIEVFLSQTDMSITCRAYRDEEDGRMQEWDIDSLSMRGAQREITSWLAGQAYTPAGRWSVESDGPRGHETVRQFRPTPASR